ncbi:MAG: PPOX class F420-dependent oxidoreductase [Anaerolineae bacterium]|nr:MAG: PPOX class F420-dependent oxidoreductase [Anaerolineae bacterium]
MSFTQFQSHQYLNLETFRKNGTGVRTPVWFAQEEDSLYVWTQADSGKAKRVRNNPQVNIAPCKADGTLLGEWLPARASRDDSDQALRYVRRLMSRKYGLAFQIFRLIGLLGRRKYTCIQIRPA